VQKTPFLPVFDVFARKAYNVIRILFIQKGLFLENQKTAVFLRQISSKNVIYFSTEVIYSIFIAGCFLLKLSVPQQEILSKLHLPLKKV